MTILILFFGVFFVSSVWAQECIKPTVLITTDDTLNDIDKDLYTEEFVNANNPVTSYECNPITNDIEFDIKVGDGKITIKKGLNFDKFDDYLDETSQTYTGQVKCTAICQNTASTSLYITITVKDTNQNDPEWNDPNPVLTLPMPLPKNLDVLLAGNLALKTTDKDFGNTEVTYELSSEAKTLFTPISTKNGKDYNLALKTTNKLNLLEDLSFTITATDNGDPTRSTEATFTLKINEDDSIPDKPNFEKSSYSYNFENGAIQPQDWDGKIVIETDQTNVEVSVDPAGAIDCIKNSDAKYTLECSYTGTDTLTKTTLYTVSAKTKDTATTTLIVFVASTGDGPQFVQSHYTANYNKDDNTLTLDNPIKTKETADSIVLVGDEYSGVLEFTKNKDEVWEITVKDSSKLTKNPTLIDFAAKSGDLQGPSSTLVINVPEKTLSITNSFYEGSYSLTDKLKIENPKLEGDDLDNVECSMVEATLADYIKVSYNKDAKVCTIELVKDFSDEILAKAEVVFTLKASLTTDVTISDTCTIVVSLPQQSSDLPKFDKPYYVGNYENKDPLDTITISDSITITSSGDLTVTATWDISEKITDYLNVNYDKDKKEVTVTVTKNFPDTVKTIPDIIVTIEAKIDDSNKGEGILVINLPSSDTTNAPKFNKPYYVGTYANKDPLDTITIAETITITSSGDPTVSLAWDISEKITDYLNVNYDKDKKEVTVAVTKNFPDTVKASQDVIVTIEAKIDESNKGEGILVINLPSSDTTNAPKFDKPYYVGNYENKDPLDTITISESITITSSGDPSVTATWDISEKIDDYLTVKYDTDKKEVTVTVTKNFPDTVKASQDIIVTIEAKLDDNIGKGILIINLPVSAGSGPKFENPTYVGSYDAQKKTLIIDDLKVQSDNLDKLTFSVNYEKIPQDSYLDVSIDTETGIVKLTTTSKELPTEEDYIVATISATDENNLIGSATILIFVTKDNPTDPPEFLISHYEATYDQNSQTVTLAQKIAFKNAQPDSILLSGEDAKYFTVEKVEEEWKININSPITDEMLHKDNVIVQMTAHGGTDVQSRATLIVLLPGLSAQYNQRSYSAVYTSDDDFSVDSKITIDNYLSTVQPKLVSSDYQSFFAISSNGNEVTLAKTGRLTDEIKLKSFITLTIALQEGDETTDTSVVNIKLPGGGGGGDDDDDKDELEKKNKTIKGYIAAVSVLSVLLAAVIGGFAALYLLKFRRSKNYNTMEEEYSVRQASPETKTAEKYDTPIGSVSQRRATGFVFNPPPPEEDEEDEEKTVKFNENVEQIKIEKSQDGSDYEEEEKPEKTETKEEDKEVKTNDDDLL